MGNDGLEQTQFFNIQGVERFIIVGVGQALPPYAESVDMVNVLVWFLWSKLVTIKIEIV